MLLVQKYGGATLSDPKKIREVAKRISDISKTGTRLIVVVSAMGKTTNTLIDLANQVADNPQKRELDMLLSAGERISMALVSMALNQIDCQAISFTGSQAGIFTNDSHLNAMVTDIKAFRVEESIQQGKVVILAGFQGVSPVTKEITTLGRGGSDTSAVAMAAAFQAERCEILKDVPAVFSADPKLIPEAKEIHELTFEQLMDMTFWGAKVLHYRSVELAKIRNVKLYIGPAAHLGAKGTLVQKNVKGHDMFETAKPLSLNSHETVLKIGLRNRTEKNFMATLNKFLVEKQIAAPQVLEISQSSIGTELLLTGPSEVVEAMVKNMDATSPFEILNQNLCTITMTCTGASSLELPENITAKLATNNISFEKIILSAMSVTVVMAKNDRENGLKSLHQLI